MGGARGKIFQVHILLKVLIALQVVAILEKIFSRPGKVKYSNIHLLAVLIGALYRYHQDFAIGVIDNVLEQITLGLEQNDFKFNQRRIAEAKYLGELYNYKMVDSTVIFDTLYRIVTFGHEGGTPSPGKVNPLDLPDDFFRIRLVCAILDTCGICFDRGSSRKKLDFFLTFFQYYILTKDSPPMDIDFLVQDTYALVRPQWKLVSDLSEAARLFSEAVAVNYKLSAQDKAAEAEEEAEDSASDEAIDEDGPHDINDAESSSEEADVSPNMVFWQFNAYDTNRSIWKTQLLKNKKNQRRNRFLSQEKKRSLTLRLKLISIKLLRG